jgi:uncharacterized membrane protein
METTSAAPPAAARTRSATTLSAAGIFLVVAIVFLVSTPGWYLVFKTVHILAAIVWLGGGAILLVLAVLAQARSDRPYVAQIARQAAFCGERIFAPAGLVVVVMGIAMMINGDLDWGQFWVIAGLIGYAITFVVGIAVLSPLAKKVNASVETNGLDHPETEALIDRILMIARFDIAMLLLVVVDMVAKPFSY